MMDMINNKKKKKKKKKRGFGGGGVGVNLACEGGICFLYISL